MAQQPDRRATLYLHRGSRIRERVDTTDYGIPITGPEVHVLPSDIDDMSLGVAIADVASRALRGVPHPDMDSPDLLWPLLQAAGVASWSTFIRGTVDVSIFIEGSDYTFVPSINRGPRGGFAASPHRLAAASDDPAGIGRAAKEGIALASVDPTRG